MRGLYIHEDNINTIAKQTKDKQTLRKIPMFAIFFLAAVSREAGASWEEIKLTTDKCLLQANSENVAQTFRIWRELIMPHESREPSSSISEFNKKN